MKKQMIGTCTYSPEDNKLRIYPTSRLSKELYERVRGCGFIWASKQELFVAPTWTPEREDLALELCGEVEDEEKGLVARAEERAERFENYSDKRNDEAEQARKTVEKITSYIPMGQPILVGHHSEKRARRDAEKIHNNMGKAVRLWETSKYWEARARSVLKNAERKEKPDVRARRIKGLEADKRRQERYKVEAEKWLKLWSNPELTLEQAQAIANICWLNVVNREDGSHWTASDVLASEETRWKTCPSMTIQQVQEIAQRIYPEMIKHLDRWLQHIENRLHYERTLLTADGGTEADKTTPEIGGACQCWASPRGGWSYIQKVNKVSVTVLDNWGNGGANFTRTMPFDKLNGVMTRVQIEELRDSGRLSESADKRGFIIATEKEKQP